MKPINKIWKGHVKSGKFTPDDGNFKSAFWPHEGKRVDVVVRRETKKKSNRQNRYMWGVVYELIANQTGYQADDIHRMMTMKFLKEKIGDEFVAGSTKGLTTASMEDYLSKIRVWASQYLNLYIPLPNEVDY